MFKIYYAAASPYVRKCLVGAYELGLHERIELLPANAHPVNRGRAIVGHNPLGKIPTLITDDGTALYGSRVIFEYLNELGDGNLIPSRGPSTLERAGRAVAGDAANRGLTPTIRVRGR